MYRLLSPGWASALGIEYGTGLFVSFNVHTGNTIIFSASDRLDGTEEVPVGGGQSAATTANL
jgi:hypothetical protein